MALEELQNGRYRFSRVLGVGGMGEVFLMQDERVARQVAIKVIRSENSISIDKEAATDAARLFQREARAIAALEHPNILPLYDFGEEISEDTTLSYMVMPYCPEGSLATWLRQHGERPLLPQDIAYLIEQAAEGLQYAHDHNVIHLDVKPSNFLLRSNKRNPDRPTLLLADFGIARSSSTIGNTSRTIRGTPTAMAPEQWMSQPVPATDQYALAVMAFEMLTGRTPFVGSIQQLMYQHFSTPPPAPDLFNARLPEALNTVLTRALAKKPEERYPSIAAFASALKDAVQSAAPDPRSDAERSVIENYMTVAVSKEEADSGISRMVTLPGGKKVDVQIPAGTHNGQLIRVPGSTATIGESSAVVFNVLVEPTGGLLQPDEALIPAPEAPVTPQQVYIQSSETPVIPTLAKTDVQSSETPVPSLAASSQLPIPVSGHDLPTLAVGSSLQPPEQVGGVPKKTSPFRFGLIAIISLLVLLLIAGSSLIYLVSSRNSGQLSANANHPTAVVAQVTTTPAKPTPTPTLGVTATPIPKDGMYIPGTYKGSMFNNTTQQTIQLTVFLVQTKGTDVLQGSVTFSTNSNNPELLNGTVDTQGNFSFSVAQSSGQKPLLFYGAVLKGDGGNYLKGNFCNSTTNVCLSQLGYFYVGPGYTS